MKTDDTTVLRIYNFVIEENHVDGGYVAYAPGLTDTLVTDGKTLTEVKANIRDLIETYVATCIHYGDQPAVQKSFRIPVDGGTPSKLQVYDVAVPA